MERISEEMRVPNFTRRKNGGGNNDHDKTGILNGLFGVTLYSDGDEHESEGYVSIELQLGLESLHDILCRSLTSYHMNLPENEKYVSDNVEEFSALVRVCLKNKSIQFTVSLVDTNGESRFPQSFRIEVDEGWVEHSIRLERFIRRRVLLDSREELLPEDTLTLRFEAVFFLKKLFSFREPSPERADYDLLRLRKVAQEESWFIPDVDYARSDVVVCCLLDLRNPESPLCTRLREKSEFFEALFQTPSKREEDQHVPIVDEEFDAFLNMLGYVRFENLQHIQSDIEYCDLYRMADKYGVIELQKLCSEYLQKHLTRDLAIHVLWTADLCDDVGLRTAAFKQALCHWTDNVSNDYKIFTEVSSRKLSKSIRELTCAVKILNLEDETCDTLRDLAAKRVLLNRVEVQHSQTWSVFARGMPNLAKVILSLDSEEYNPVDKYREHAFSYDFYR